MRFFIDTALAGGELRLLINAALLFLGIAVINQVLVEMGGDGGVITIDAAGNIAMPFNTAGMYRASIDTNGKVFVGIYDDE